MASGLAKGAWKRGKRIAFGDGRRIIWGPWSEEIFRYNPNVARPGSEGSPDIEWVDFYKGHRHYNRMVNSRWVWNMKFRPMPGEIFFNIEEMATAQEIQSGFILIEPNVPQQKSVAINKQWSIGRFQFVADELRSRSLRVVQLKYKGARYLLDGVEYIVTAEFRQALAVLSRASLFIGHEGGMHHAAAALDIPGVVIFGGFIPPQVTGYPIHVNLTGRDSIACGNIKPCTHCQAALDSIETSHVLNSAFKLLSQTNKVA